MDLVYPAWGCPHQAPNNPPPSIPRQGSERPAMRLGKCRAGHHSVKRGIITKDYGEVAGFAARPQRMPAAANESLQPGCALSLLLPRHSSFRQRQAFQPASFISICELSPRPKQRNALQTKISGKKPLICLNLAIFQANLSAISPLQVNLREKTS